MSKNIKIVLDSDVLIHFSKGKSLHLLHKIFPEYEYIILDVVYDEIRSIQTEVDNIIKTFKAFNIVKFMPSNEILKEYAVLKKTFGRGESACMSYCKYTNNIIGSSNLRDIQTYCEKENITYLTTIDFLYYAYERKVMSSKECDNFILEVKEKGSRLPQIDIKKHYCNKL